MTLLICALFGLISLYAGVGLCISGFVGVGRRWR